MRHQLPAAVAVCPPFRLALAFVLAAGLVAGPALAASTPSTKERVDVLEQDLRDALAHVAEMREQMAALDKEVRELRASLGMDQPGQRISPADLAARISSVETDLRVIFENQNEAGRRLAVLSDKVDAVFRQMSALQASSVAAAATSAPVGAGLASPETAEATTEDVGAPDTAPAAGRPLRAAAVPAGPLVDPEELYQSARADFGRSSYDLAESGFQQFLESFPNSDLADNAMYWVGECRYARAEHERAIEAFDAVLTRWPTADKTPDAAYKKGLGLLELNRTAEGIVQLQKVKDSWPDSPAGRLARGKLQSLGLL